MARLGHEVIVFTTSIDPKSHVEEFEGMKIYRGATNFKVDNKARFSFHLFSKPIKQDVDIVHAHFYVPSGDLAGLFYAKVKRKPLIVSYHADMGGNIRSGRLIRRIGRSLFNRFVVPRILSSAKVIISPSEHYISQSHFLPKHREKIIAIPYGIDPEEIEVPYTKEECRGKLSLPIDDKIILFVGYLVQYKSPDLLIESLPLVIERIPEAKLVFVGDGPLRQDLEMLAKKLNVGGKVEFTGMVPDDLKALYYNSADVFALPSTTSGESFGIVLLEAAAAGLPIVVSSLTSFRAFIEDGYNGLMTKLGDVNSLAEAMIRVLCEPALAARIGENAKIKVREYSWEKIAKRTEKVYQSAITNI
jgi:glycosyltransferase involved in cell wall biosynthesis